MQLPIYLDYAATTPVADSVIEKMQQFLGREGRFGNASSRAHLYGWLAEEAVEGARRDVADLIGCDPREVIWTSGATESNNLAIKGVAQANAGRGRHIVTSCIEHKAVLDTCEFLATQGFEVSWLQPDAHGCISPAKVAAALRPDTILVSLMHVNNEVGTINDIASIGQIVREHGAYFHVDAAQSAGKLPIDLRALPVDLMSLSAHKVYGPKGVGALYVRREPPVILQPQMHGGAQERGLRAGTLATHQLVGMGEAFRLAAEQLASEQQRLWMLRHQLLDGLAALPGWQLAGHPEQTAPGIINLAFADVDGESLLMGLRTLAVSTGSACASADLKPSHVLKGMGLDDALAQSALRISLGRYTTGQEVQQAVTALRETVTGLRAAARKNRVNQVV